MEQTTKQMSEVALTWNGERRTYRLPGADPVVLETPEGFEVRMTVEGQRSSYLIARW